jgi:hypothetical protein
LRILLKRHSACRTEEYCNLLKDVAFMSGLILILKLRHIEKKAEPRTKTKLFAGHVPKFGAVRWRGQTWLVQF